MLRPLFFRVVCYTELVILVITRIIWEFLTVLIQLKLQTTICKITLEGKECSLTYHVIQLMYLKPHHL